MKVYKEILKELRTGKSLDEIRKKYRSQSQIYLAIRIHSEETEKKLRKTRLELANSETELADVKKKLEVAKQEKAEATEEIQDLDAEKERATQERNSIKEEINQLKTEIEELRALGYTEEMIKKIREVEARSGKKLLKQLKTTAKFNQTRKKYSKIKRKKRIAENEVHRLLLKIAELKRALLYKENMLDEINVRVAIYEEAVRVVENLLKSGYSVDDITSLVSGLIHFGIEGDPKTSIARFVRALKKMKDLHTLNKEVGKAEKKLAVVKSETEKTTQESEVVEETTIKIIREEKDAALESIDNIGARANSRLEEAAAKFEDTLEKGEDEIRGIAEACREGLGEYSSLQQEIGKLKEHIFYGRVLFGMLNSTDYLKTIPPTVVAEILDRVALWIRLNCPEFSISPSPSIIQKESKLIAIWKYNLAALIDFAAEGLSYMKEKNARTQAGDSLA